MAVYLIGTVHIDLEGQKRLEHLLQVIKPKTITIEAILLHITVAFFNFIYIPYLK